jgi:hypothetical protein
VCRYTIPNNKGNTFYQVASACADTPSLCAHRVHIYTERARERETQTKTQTQTQTQTHTHTHTHTHSDTSGGLDGHSDSDSLRKRDGPVVENI